MQVPWGYVSGLQSDPIEKKPFYHVLPGSNALTFGMLGCNFHCDFCQNWVSSQALRDPAANYPAEYVQPITPDKVISAARRAGARVIASSYNEPLITPEWAAGIFGQALTAGIKCALVSNGHATPEALAYLLPYLSAIKIDLKSMQQENYRAMGGSLKAVLDTIQLARASGLWVEVVTLVIPGFNNKPDELWETARFLSSVSPEIPWHVTAFHPDYRMLNTPYTSSKDLQQAAEIGQEAGLRYVYAGNLPGRVGSLEDTFCPSCQTRLVHRSGFNILDNRITSAGACPNCSTKIAGIWG